MARPAKITPLTLMQAMQTRKAERPARTIVRLELDAETLAYFKGDRRRMEDALRRQSRGDDGNMP